MSHSAVYPIQTGVVTLLAAYHITQVLSHLAVHHVTQVLLHLAVHHVTDIYCHTLQATVLHTGIVTLCNLP